MKKILFSIGFILAIILSANAQPGHRAHRRPQPRIGDNIGEVRLHVAGEIGFADIGGLFMHESPYHYSVGGMVEFQTARCLSLGLGAEYYGIRHINEKLFSPSKYLNCVPVYGNVRVNTSGFTKLFVDVQMGYAIPANQINFNQSSGTVVVQTPIQAKGFYSGAAVGINFYGNNISVGFHSVDITNAETNQPLYSGNNRKLLATDFYLRYSYAFPLN